MAFVDDLTLILDLLILLTVVVFYTALCVWVEYRRKDLDRAMAHLRGGSMMMGVLGGAIGLVALWGELTWPLPGSYNLFFFDPLFMLSLILVGFALAVHRNYPTHMVGLFSAVASSGIIYYGARAYILHLTLDPLETFLLYLGFGAAGIAAYPATLFVDWFIVGPKTPSASPLPSHDRPDYPWLWYVLVGGFCLLVVLAGIAAVFYGFDTAWGHLQSPP
ncbi:MAG TPA: DUF981 family protein [Thermoplasmata archaeon]|nr:DUF981 family protein [Thermoplasmata archaeon]